METRRKVAFYTLGCKLNFSETSALAGVFVNNGFERVNHSQPADIYVINTCSVTEQADRKCRQTIRKFIRQSPNAIIAVTGCYAQLKPEEIAAVEGVDLVLGADAKGRLFEYVNSMRNKGETRIFSCEINSVDSFFQAFSSGDRTRSFLKVQDGCDYKCAYCTIPKARGKSRNPSVASIVDEATKISAAGTKEIILTGVNIGDFGRSGNEKFLDLLKALDNVEGIERFRISSIEPNLLTDEIIDFISQSGKFLPHYHIPLQSGSDKILKLMRRRYLTQLFRDKVEILKSKDPYTFFGIDVIAGFPGETDEDFEDTYRFLEELNPAYLHIFPYSERPGTDSVKMEAKLSGEIINTRVKRLNELCQRLHRNFYIKNIGREEKVLFESAVKKGVMYGFTRNYIKTEIPYRKDLAGKIVSVKLQDIADSGNMTVKIHSVKLCSSVNSLVL
ncbi:MAG: tRNA (N(6)-L-threonylcarbamoyladenosine(37)-C(2))-methylthiotransferase MtaB [Prevotellaceae bacterium]|jgi:threonylcarbamoyladenosine tRNA methylthiotransferase MtaB|nr:tRNA (N(6)-L-threonylcarbamoyladenosine(37)-C(2))-methylthiotransferase MtaB [Prevotellaceae bacterium]